MALNLAAAVESDADRIAAIYMAAFDANMMLRAQFPTATIRDKFRILIAHHTVKDIQSPKRKVFVVRNRTEIISFASWDLPECESEEYEELPWRWPEGTNVKILREWDENMKAAKRKTLGDTPCYCKWSEDLS